MSKKCIFTKSPENLNTAVTVTSEFGPITVYVADEARGRALSEVIDAVAAQIEQARSVSDTFGMDLAEMLGKAGLLQTAEQARTVIAPAQRVQVAPQAPPAPVAAVPVQRAQPVATESAIQETVAEGRPFVQQQQAISPSGRAFMIPQKVVDKDGEFTVVIDTDSQRLFQDAQNHLAEASYKDSYGVEFKPCKLCWDNKSKRSTGSVGGQPCSKCKGKGEVAMVRS